MKTLSVLLLLLASLAFVLLGCSDNAGPIVGSSDTRGITTAPSLLKTSGSGAWVIRGEYEDVWFGFLDANSGLIMSIGVADYSKLCAGEAGGINLLDFKELYLPNADPDLRRMVWNVKGRDVSVCIWDASLWQGHFCWLYRDYTPIAVGTANLVATDNDYYAYMQDNKNSDAFGYKANGTLASPDGGKKYELNFLYRFMWDGVDLTRYNEVFKIQLTPVGK